MSYKNLEIWKLAKEVSIEVHEMTLKLSKLEQFEEGQQIRRSSKSVRSTIVEGYGRRFYKADFIKYIIYALASNDETLDHLEILFETKSLTDIKLYEHLHAKITLLGKKLNTLLHSVKEHHSTPGEVKENSEDYPFKKD